MRCIVRSVIVIEKTRSEVRSLSTRRLVWKKTSESLHVDVVLDWIRDCVCVRVDVMLWCRVYMFRSLSSDHIRIHN